MCQTFSQLGGAVQELGVRDLSHQAPHVARLSNMAEHIHTRSNYCHGAVLVTLGRPQHHIFDFFAGAILSLFRTENVIRNSELKH